MPTGRLIRWYAPRGYGFIKPDVADAEGDLFAHANDFVAGGIANPMRGERYGFMHGVSPMNGRRIATDIKPAGR